MPSGQDITPGRQDTTSIQLLRRQAISQGRQVITTPGRQDTTPGRPSTTPGDSIVQRAAWQRTQFCSSGAGGGGRKSQRPSDSLKHGQSARSCLPPARIQSRPSPLIHQWRRVRKLMCISRSTSHSSNSDWTK